MNVNVVVFQCKQLLSSLHPRSDLMAEILVCQIPAKRDSATSSIPDTSVSVKMDGSECIVTSVSMLHFYIFKNRLPYM